MGTESLNWGTLTNWRWYRFNDENISFAPLQSGARLRANALSCDYSCRIDRCNVLFE